MTTELADGGGLAAQLRDAAVEAARVALMASRLRELAALLIARGLRVVIRTPVMTVSNPATANTDNPHGLVQSVLLRCTDEGLIWFWVRLAARGAGGTRQRPEVERLCPGDDIDQAARRISQVLRRTPSSGRPTEPVPPAMSRRSLERLDAHLRGRRAI
jgi:hypothetical protein